MPNLLAMSFEGTLAPSFELTCLGPSGRAPDGWGVGHYPGGDPAAVVLKEPAPRQGSIRSELLRTWEHLEASAFVLHIRRAQWGPPSNANTQPFLRSWGGSDWLYAHSGSLTHRVESDDSLGFQPVGSTDTELLFCRLMSRIADHGFADLAAIPPDLLRSWFDEFNEHGSMSTVMTDGTDLVAYADRAGNGGLFLAELRPPHGDLVFEDDELRLDLARRGIKAIRGILISSSPLQHPADASLVWRQLPAGALVIVRQGVVRWEVAPGPSNADGGSDGSTSAPMLVVRRTLPTLPRPATPRRMSVLHRTEYEYVTQVERSVHQLRLRPVEDHLQRLTHHRLSFSVDGVWRDFADVFGNMVRRVQVDVPFRSLVIESYSEVELLDVDPFSVRPPHGRSRIPLAWMPWQGQVLQPFLLPPELPETQLAELVEYAMGFVRRNDYDILDTLLDINNSIHDEYVYAQGSTTLQTTPFDVYCERRGVCQDFSNLFICLARLLGVPARYVCGYVHPGVDAANQVQSEASHAWVQVYLPEVGWKGFDPTNGKITQTEHIRVAVGRNYVDATPTSGTIFAGGSTETLRVDVHVKDIG